MTEVYSILAHGKIISADVLNHKERNMIGIVAMGTEGKLTYVSPTMLLIHFFMKKYGPTFMKKLLSILVEHGEKYVSSFVPNNTLLEQDIRFLFNVNGKDLKKYPSNVLRAYYGQTTIANMELYVNIPYETLLYRSLLKNEKFDTNQSMSFSGAGAQYEFETIFYPPDSMMLGLTQPFGLLRFAQDNNHKNVLLKTIQQPVSLKNVLDYIHHTSASKNKIVFLTCCKGMEDGSMMDFDITEHPIEKVYTRSLVQMMTSLKLNNTPSQKKKTITKRKKTPSPSRSLKRPKLI